MRAIILKFEGNARKQGPVEKRKTADPIEDDRGAL